MVQTTSRPHPKATPPRVELTQLTWDKDSKTLASEASTLFGPLRETMTKYAETNGVPRMFDIHSPKTGRVYRFRLQRTHVVEGDARLFIYGPIAAECPVDMVFVYNT